MNIEKNQFIDEIFSYDAGKSILCKSVLPVEAPVFEGHFPGNPILPGVLMVEAMAQASGFLYFMDNHFENMLYLASIKSAKFYDFVTPGETLNISASVAHIGSGYILTKCKIEKEKRVATAELFLKSMPFPSVEMKNTLLNTVGEKINQFRRK